MSLPYDAETVWVTIAAGASLSSVANLGAKVIVGFVLPPVWTAAPISILASSDGTTFQPIWNIGGTIFQIAAAAAGAGGAFIPTDPSAWRGVNMITMLSGSPGSAVNQAAAAMIGIVIRSEQ